MNRYVKTAAFVAVAVVSGMAGGAAWQGIANALNPPLTPEVSYLTARAIIAERKMTNCQLANGGMFDDKSARICEAKLKNDPTYPYAGYPDLDAD